MLESVTRGDFYVKRMQWAMGDLVHNRPPLSRWHPEFGPQFEKFINDSDA